MQRWLTYFIWRIGVEGHCPCHVPAQRRRPGNGSAPSCARHDLCGQCAKPVRPDKSHERSCNHNGITDSRIPRTDPPNENTQDVIPANERNQDPVITEMTID